MRRKPKLPQTSRVTADCAEVDAIETALKSGVSRERLLEILLDVRDSRGSISEAGLVYLADRLRLHLSEVYEVATAFPAVNYRSAVLSGSHAGHCGDLVCAMLRRSEHSGAEKLDYVCRGRCDRQERLPAIRSFEAFCSAGGYTVLDSLRREPGERRRVLELVGANHKIGRAGVGFPVAQKWQSVMASGEEPIVIINGDEGELATFKDRFIMESDPHGVLEAALVTSEVIGAKRIFFYLRDDYTHLHPIILQAINDVSKAGLADEIEIELRRSGGAYICGEETALIASLEGRPARPHERPPYPTERGYLGKPTLVHNVETFYRLRAVWGAVPEKDIPVSFLQDHDVLLFSVSGRVREPGPKLISKLPTLEVLVRLAGGMSDGAELGGVVIGGSAGTIVPAELCRVPLGDLLASGLRLGTGSVIVFGTEDDKRWIAARMAAFLARESCGQCSPCRIGTTKAAKALSSGPLDGRLLEDLAAVMREASLCALGRDAGYFLGRVQSVLTEGNR